MVFGRKKGKKGSTDDNAAGTVDSAMSADERDADFSALNDAPRNDSPTDEQNGLHGDSNGSETSTEQGSELSQELDRLNSEVADLKDRNLRVLAEFENFKKRTVKERSELLKYQGERIFYDLLNVVDNFDLALQHAQADPAKLKEGVELIHKLLQDLLGRWEVRCESGVGRDFDPNIHNAISNAPVANAKPGSIISELKKTYFYKDKLLRPGEVVVAQAPPSSEAEDSSSPED